MSNEIHQFWGYSTNVMPPMMIAATAKMVSNLPFSFSVSVTAVMKPFFRSAMGLLKSDAYPIKSESQKTLAEKENPKGSKANLGFLWTCGESNPGLD